MTVTTRGGQDVALLVSVPLVSVPTPPNRSDGSGTSAATDRTAAERAARAVSSGPPPSEEEKRSPSVPIFRCFDRDQRTGEARR
eukprot:8595060-Pyramimonas_sp.AAC.1